jgi:DNA-binding NarL/FixJ family response regulator
MTETLKQSLVNVLILSENHITRCGLRRILESKPGFHVTGEGSIGSTAVGALVRQRPIILLDLDPNGVDILGKLDSLARTTTVIVLYDLGHDELARKALGLGVAGIVLKSQPPSVLIAMLQTLHESHRMRPVHMTLSLNERAANTRGDITAGASHARDRIDSLTARERDIIRLIARGLRNKEVADRLHISDITVRHHLTSIFSKLDVSDRQKLLIVAHQQGIVEFSKAE